MRRERITVVVNSAEVVTEMAAEANLASSGETNHHSGEMNHQYSDDDLFDSQLSQNDSHSKGMSTSSSHDRSRSTTPESMSTLNESLEIVPHFSPRSPQAEPDLVISVGDQDFYYFSEDIAYMSDYLSQQMVQIEDEKLRIDFTHKNADEWEQYVFPFLEKYSNGMRSGNLKPTVHQRNVGIVLPWFQEFGLQGLLRDCDEILTSLPFVMPPMAGSSLEFDDRSLNVSGQDIRDAVSLMNIAFSCSLPQTQARAADLVHKYLQHSPKAWLLLDDRDFGSFDDDEDDSEENDGDENVSIFVRLTQVLQEYPTSREFLFARYNPNILELYLPSKLIPCDKENQSPWFWEELVTNPLFPYLLRERVKSEVQKTENAQLQAPPLPPIEEKPSQVEEPKPIVEQQPPSMFGWPLTMNWMQPAPPVLSPQPTEEFDDDEEEEESEEDDEYDDDDSIVNERSRLIHEVLDKICEPQHNFPRRPRADTPLNTTSSSRRQLRLTASLPPTMPVLHESTTSEGDLGADTSASATGTPTRLMKPLSSPSSTTASGSPGSTVSTDIISVSSGSVPSLNSRRTFAC